MFMTQDDFCTGIWGYVRILQKEVHDGNGIFPVGVIAQVMVENACMHKAQQPRNPIAIAKAVFAARASALQHVLCDDLAK